jgi:hypothetical protein
MAILARADIEASSHMLPELSDCEKRNGRRTFRMLDAVAGRPKLALRQYYLRKRAFQRQPLRLITLHNRSRVAEGRNTMVLD